MTWLLVQLLILGFAIAAWRRAERLERRLDDLERRRPGTVAPAPTVQPAPPPAAVPAHAAEIPTPEAPPAVDRSEGRDWTRDAPTASPPPVARAPQSRIEWEQLFGVRGAAVLGAIALGLAGLLFFKYSIEHGLIPPWLRVVIGVAVGLGAVLASEVMLRRRYEGTANALAGGGIVVLYAAWWGASVRYGLVPLGAGFVLMILTTAACCALSWRHRSEEIALLGLIGGFATPALLSTGADRPIGLFGYVLLLNVGLLALARVRGWTRVALLCLLATIVYEAQWMLLRMDADRLWIGLLVAATFAATFAVGGALLARDDGERNGRPMLLSAIGGVVVPLAFTLYFAGRTQLDAPLPAIAGLLVALSGGACWLSAMGRRRWLGVGATVASACILAVWIGAHGLEDSSRWQVALYAVVSTLLAHAFVERDAARVSPGSTGAAVAAALAGFGLMLVIIGRDQTAAGPVLLGTSLVAAVLMRHGTLPGRSALLPVAGIALAVVAARWHLDARAVPIAARLAVLGLFGVALQLFATTRSTPEQRAAADRSAAVFPIIALVAVAIPGSSSLAVPITALLLCTLAFLSAARAREGAWLVVTIVLTAAAHTLWGIGLPTTGPSGAGLLLGGAGVVLGASWPLVSWPAFRTSPLAWRGAALATLAWFPILLSLFRTRMGDGADGLIPLALAGVAVTVAAVAHRRWPDDDPMWTTAMSWLAATAVALVAIAVPLQLEREWITIGWALQGLAVLAIWSRLDNPGLKYWGLALLAASTTRLVVNPEVLGYHPRPAWRIVNWIAYTYLVPAGALVAAASTLVDREVARLRAWEPFSERRQAIGAAACGVGAIVVVFVWLNLAVADWFATGAVLSLSLDRMPARDVAISIAWAAYALTLLGIGLWQHSVGLRWASLALLLVTIGKVFLHDLGELRDLYRVMSLVGLAVSLFLVSLVYQRFVFRKVPIGGAPS